MYASEVGLIILIEFIMHIYTLYCILHMHTSYYILHTVSVNVKVFL